MKKRVIILLAIGMLGLTACNSTKPDVNSKVDSSQNDSKLSDDKGSEEQKTNEESKDTDKGNKKTDEVTKSIADEMAEIEKASLEFENANWDSSQQEMNLKANEWYSLWDDELNSLWDRTIEAIPENKKENLIINQKDWIDRKEKNIIAAGVPVYGGSLQPFLESITAKDMTRKQAYYLASILAELTGEGYSVPDEVEASYQDVDINLSDVFESFSGTHQVSDNVKIYVSRVEDSDYTADNFPEGTSWLTWYSHSDILTDLDVYAYTNDVIVFKKESIYYILEKSYAEGNTIMSVGTELGYTEMVE